MTLDRAATRRRDRSWVAAQLDAPGSRVVAASRAGVLIDAAGQTLARRAAREEWWLGGGEPILLGLDGAAAVFAVDLHALPSSSVALMTGAARVVGLRDAGAVLPRAEAGLAAYLMAILNWHREHRFCASCGAASVVADAGYARRCTSCGTVHFPRTDPVVIMIVESENRLLLGRNDGWPPSMYSLLAGFVSPGESAEEAVVREVREESGIRAHDPKFVISQPWPFPSSLMLGFAAESNGGEPTARDRELADVRWFTREAVRSATLDGGAEFALPPPVSIARFLIERWLARDPVTG
jgi:NAD+ diphosphatase